MADFENALNSILSNPEAMGQIMNLAGMLGSSPSPGPSSESPQPEADPAPTDFNPLLGQLGPLLEVFQAGKNSDPQAVALLTALRPYLREERQGKLDRAIRLASLSKAARQAYQLWKGGELHL